MRRRSAADGVLPLGAVSLVVVVVTIGLSRGPWLANLHNGLLALTLTGVGAYVFHQQPRNRCAVALLATGVVEAVMFLGRQIGHDPSPGTSPWWGWLGVWPLVLGLYGVTVSVAVFPDGRAISGRWRRLLWAGGALAALVATISALSSAGFDSTGVATPAPVTVLDETPAASAWLPVATATFAGFQALWLVAVVARWRLSGAVVRRQLTVLGGCVALSLVVLAVGLVAWGSPTPGLLAACSVPLAAGWAILHGQYLATHSALTWLTGRGLDPNALPTELARAVAGSLAADRATLWARRDGRFHIIGTWPDDGWTIEPQAELPEGEATSTIQRAITIAGTTTGSITITRPDPWLSRHEAELLDGYCGQAALVIEHLALAATAAGGSVSGGLDHLTPREREVLGLMARGFSNAAICQELHLSKKTVEPAIGSIFAKLGLSADGESNRRVLAVLAYVQDQEHS